MEVFVLLMLFLFKHCKVTSRDISIIGSCNTNVYNLTYAIVFIRKNGHYIIDEDIHAKLAGMLLLTIEDIRRYYRAPETYYNYLLKEKTVEGPRLRMIPNHEILIHDLLQTLHENASNIATIIGVCGQYNAVNHTFFGCTAITIADIKGYYRPPKKYYQCLKGQRNFRPKMNCQ